MLTKLKVHCASPTNNTSAQAKLYTTQIDECTRENKALFRIVDVLMKRKAAPKLPSPAAGTAQLADDFLEFFIHKVFDICSQLTCRRLQTVNTVDGLCEQSVNIVDGPCEQTVNTVDGSCEQTVNTVDGPCKQTVNTVDGPCEQTVNIVDGPCTQTVNTVDGPCEQTVNIVDGPCTQTIDTGDGPCEQVCTVNAFS